MQRGTPGLSLEDEQYWDHLKEEGSNLEGTGVAFNASWLSEPACMLG